MLSSFSIIFFNSNLGRAKIMLYKVSKSIGSVENYIVIRNNIHLILIKFFKIS